MILKNIKVEHKDEKTGFVVKKIATSEWETLNHKIAINNSLFNCERQRLICKKPLLKSPFQIHHIASSKNIWDFDGIAISKQHATKQKRFFLAFQQRSEKQWNNLDFAEAEDDFQELATRGLPFVPYSIPLNANLENWKKRKDDANSILNKSQMLVPVFCSKHQIDLFDDVYNYEFEKSKLIGMQCYSLNDATTLLNLMKLRLRNMRLEAGDEAPLLLGLNYSKFQRKIAHVSGSFAYSCFGFDIFSERQTFLENMPPQVVSEILNKSIDEIMRYDRVLGGFNQSAEQEFWDGRNITQEFLENVAVAEGLTPYQAIQWANYRGQQGDFNLLNNYILETANEDKKDLALNFIQNDKEKWSVFWKTKMIKLLT